MMISTIAIVTSQRSSFAIVATIGRLREAIDLAPSNGSRGVSPRAVRLDSVPSTTICLVTGRFETYRDAYTVFKAFINCQRNA